MVAASLSLVVALALTGVLAAWDHQNASAASSSRANSGRDAMAMQVMSRVASTIGTAHVLERDGIVGLVRVAMASIRAEVVSPLGGTLLRLPRSWTLALGGGWSCLTLRGPSGASVRPVVSRGVCANQPIQSSPGVSVAMFRRALLVAARQQRAAMDAAFVTAAISRSERGEAALRSVAALEAATARLAHLRFRPVATATGLAVVEADSVACLVPAPAARVVVVRIGACGQMPGVLAR